jgi:6,7-dimethyl-8-ribityllumazine synthase
MARYAVVVARFYEDLADRLEHGATGVLESEPDATVEVITVPGAFELPAAALYAAETRRYRGLVCLGVVIRGETDHYQHVCEAATRGIQEVTLRTGVPCGFGVLTVDTREQALARSGGGVRDSGASAARAMLSLAGTRERMMDVSGPPPPDHAGGSGIRS